MVQKEFVDWEQVESYIKFVVANTQNRKFTGVFGMPKGGLVLAVMLSYALDIPLLSAPAEGCLIVDDIADSGETLKHWAGNPKYFITTMYYHQNSIFEPELWYLQKTDRWVVYRWEDLDAPSFRKYENSDYEIGSNGEIRRLIQKEKRYSYIKPLIDRDNYAYVNLSVNGVRTTWRWHRLIASMFIANPDNKPEIDHIDGDRLNNAVSNLQWVTRQENMNKAKESGNMNFENTILSFLETRLTLASFETIKTIINKELINKETK